MGTTGPLDPRGHQETWEEKLHKIEEATTNELGMAKYRSPCRWCCGCGKLVLRAIVKDHF